MDFGALLAQAGVAGAGLWLFATGKLMPKSVVDELISRLTALYEKRISDMAERYTEMKNDRNEWRKLALGTEKRLDVATPTVATALGAPVPSPATSIEDGR